MLLPPPGHHTVYIGVHVPKSYHRRRRHRRKSSHKEKRERTEHSYEGHKSDADESNANILKPLSEFVYTSVSCVCLCVCTVRVVVLGGWVYSKQPGNHSLHDIRVSFVEEAKGSCESWVGWWKRTEKKYPSTEFRDGEDWSTVFKRCWVLWKWLPTPVDGRRETAKKKTK